MTAFNNEISSSEKIGLHLAEIGRLQNNAGAILQFTAILFAICVYFFNAYVFPATDAQDLYAVLLLIDSAALVFCCLFYLRCLSVSVGWSKSLPSGGKFLPILSRLPESDVEEALIRILRSFRRGTYCFFFSFFFTLFLLVVVAFGTMQK